MSILNLLSQKDYIAYNKHFAKEVGVDEAIVFGELCSICNIHGEEFYFEQHRIIEETCLTEYRIRNALKNLQDFGLVSVAKKGLPAKNYYSLNEKVLLEAEIKKLQVSNETQLKRNEVLRADNIGMYRMVKRYQKKLGIERTERRVFK